MFRLYEHSPFYEEPMDDTYTSYNSLEDVINTIEIWLYDMTVNEWTVKVSFDDACIEIKYEDPDIDVKFNPEIGVFVTVKININDSFDEERYKLDEKIICIQQITLFVREYFNKIILFDELPKYEEQFFIKKLSLYFT